MIVLAAVLLFLAVALVTDGRAESRYLALLFVILASVLLVVELTPIDTSTSRGGYSVPVAAAAAPPLITTTSTVPAERIAPTPPASVVHRGETTSTTSAGTAVTGDLGVFKVTCYGPPHFPAGQTTASGDPVGPGSVGVDPAVIPLGTRLEIEGYGAGVANDRGSAVHGRHIDVWRADPYHDCPVRSARVRVVS